MNVSLRPDPLFAALGDEFSDPVTPARFPKHILRWRNDAAAARLGLTDMSNEHWLAAFGRFEPLPGAIAPPRAMRYHGHQFRHYNPDLGDGRGFLFGQYRDHEGRLLDLAAKGSGQTPYSRSGDGRLTLKGGVREVLAAAMLEAQGVKTSKALSLIETGEALERNDEPSPTRSAVLVRLQHSHVRFGAFQRCAYENRPDLLLRLTDHVGEAYFPEILTEQGPARVVALLGEGVNAAARLAASWMAAGFVHGVLNTDNFVVTGESFDYGPWRFLPASIPGFTAAYFDEHGLYCFARQPEATAWALAQWASSLSLIAESEALTAALARFPAAYQTALRSAMFARLALAEGDLRADLTDMAELFEWMTQSAVPWDQFFHDWFAGEASATRAAQSPIAPLYATPAFAAVRARFFARAPVRPERLSHPYFARERPASLVIDEVEALWRPIAEADDWSAFEAKLAAIAEMKEALALAVS